MVRGDPKRPKCSSWWGRKGNKWQPGQLLTLGEGCDSNGRCYSCYTDDTIIHEFIHAIGFAHEHNRFDRDSYVTIHKENIKKGSQSQFDNRNKLDWLTFGTEYDGKSIMHYTSTSGSKNGKPVMTSKVS